MVKLFDGEMKLFTYNVGDTVERLKATVAEYSKVEVTNFRFKIGEQVCANNTSLVDLAPDTVLRACKQSRVSAAHQAMKRVQLGKTGFTRKHREYVTTKLSTIDQSVDQVKEQTGHIIELLQNPGTEIGDWGFRKSTSVVRCALCSGSRVRAALCVVLRV